MRRSMAVLLLLGIAMAALAAGAAAITYGIGAAVGTEVG